MTKPSDSGPGSKRRPVNSGGKLHLVATPVGNLGDISPRAVEVLRAADVIACEDSRVTGSLLHHLGVKRPLVAYHDHNADEMRPKLLARLAAGENVALVSDAGTPLISDPGYKLVRAAAEAGIGVTALPGPSAPILALILSGLPTDRFLFSGFLPNRTGARREALNEVAGIKATLIFFETAPRLADSLADCAAILGARPAAVARELTKLYEEVRRGTLPDLARHYAEAGPPKGEIVLVIGPPGAEARQTLDLDSALRDALKSMRIKDAAAAVAGATGRSSREVYARALELQKAGRQGD